MSRVVWQLVKEPDLSALAGDLKRRHLIVEAAISALRKAPEPMTTDQLVVVTGYSKKSLETTLYTLAKQHQAVRHAWLRRNRKIDIEGLERFQSVQKWLSSLKPGPSRKAAVYRFYHYLAYIRRETNFESPDQKLPHIPQINLVT